MSDNDVLVDLLDHTENKTNRKPENIRTGGNGDGDHPGGYDLTNPNLHHGVDDVYRPVPSSEQLRSSPSIDAGVSSATIAEIFQRQADDNGATASGTAEQNTYEDQSSSPDVSSHFLAPVAGNALTFSSPLPAGRGIDSVIDGPAA